MTNEDLIAKCFEVSEVLYNADVAGTMCAENKAVDEYDYYASVIVTHELVDFEKVADLFDEYFDSHYDKDALEKIFPTIKRIVLS